MTNSNDNLWGENWHKRRDTNTPAQTCLCLKSEPVKGRRSHSSSSQTTDINSFHNKSLFIFFFTLMSEPLTLQSSPPSWGNAFWFRGRACREGLEQKRKKKQWKSTGNSPSAVERKAYHVSHCCSAVLLVLACCWWTVVCGMVGLCRARMEAPADPVSSVMDEFGWKLSVVLWPCWLHACFMGRCCDPLIHSPLQLLRVLFMQLINLTQNKVWKKKKKIFKAIFSYLFVCIYLLSRLWEGEKDALASAGSQLGAVPCRGAH